MRNSEPQDMSEQQSAHTEPTDEKAPPISAGALSQLSAEECATDKEPTEQRSVQTLNEELVNKIKRAEHLLFRRRVALEREAEARAKKRGDLVRALRLLELKPKMEQKEMAELLGVRLRELDALLAEAEKSDLVARIEPDEPDMRKVLVRAADDALVRVETMGACAELLVPELAEDELSELFMQLDKIIEPLAAMKLDEDDRSHKPREGERQRRTGGRDRRAPGDRSHGKFGAPRMGFGGSRGGHAGLGGAGSRERGGSKSYGKRH